jgi:hypothetical protein
MNDQIKKTSPSSIDDAEVVKLLSRLVSVPSVNSAFRQPGDPDHWFNEAKLGAVVADWLRSSGIEVEVDFVAAQRPNVIAPASRRSCASCPPARDACAGMSKSWGVPPTPPSRMKASMR